MEALNDYQLLMEIIAGLTTLGVCFKTYQGIAKSWKRSKDEHKAEVLHEAKEQIAKVKIVLQSEIDSINSRIDTIKNDHEKDISHIRETYNGEIKNLGTKIEELRSELRNQHSQLVQLLSKMIDSRD